jgi:glycosyltransferase involved in cell wall biosynthesis
MNHPTISVVIPLYNRKDYIIHTLESIKQQTYQPLEVIVVDDDSTDGGAFLVELYAQRNKLSIRLVRNKRSKGVSGARNTGVEYALGEYIAFLDSDDVWVKDHLKKVKESINRTQAELISTNFNFFGLKEICDHNVSFFNRLKRKMLRSGFEYMGEDCYLSDERLFSAALSGGFSLRVQATVVHKDIFHVHNVWFDEKLRYLEDHQFYLECAYNRITMAYIDQIGVMIRKHRDDGHYDKTESHRYRMDKMIQTFDCRSMTPLEQDLFHRATHEMGFILIKGEEGPDKRKNIFQRAIDSLKFLTQFPTNRGLREAIKNILGDMPSKTLVSIIKRG